MESEYFRDHGKDIRKKYFDDRKYALFTLCKGILSFNRNVSVRSYVPVLLVSTMIVQVQMGIADGFVKFPRSG